MISTRASSTDISTHAPLAGRDHAKNQPEEDHEDFNPRAPCGARPGVGDAKHRTSYFNPRAPCGARRPGMTRSARGIGFQPTRPLRGATPGTATPSLKRVFQPTRPLRGATTVYHKFYAKSRISTHAPLAGRDLLTCIASATRSHFNPRAPCGARRQRCSATIRTTWISTHAPLAGRDGYWHELDADGLPFQPTRPLRGATKIPPA